MSAVLETVRTADGTVKGVPARLPSVTVFKGIPYAASTAGDGRWRPPLPTARWEGVRLADTFGDVSPQAEDTEGVAKSEDCLNLNVWTAATDPGERRPVLVWVHGGRFLFGHGSSSHYDGSSMAGKGIVVVTINFRTGVFGFLAHPELSRESGHDASGNYGLLDVMAALRWVRTNIAAFGGDPARVTVAGHSSGGATVMDLVYSPLAKGLFDQALVQSAALFPRDPAIGTLCPSHRTKDGAERGGVAYAAERGATTLQELRALPVEKLLEGSGADDTDVPGNPPPPLFRPVIDGWVLPKNYWETLDSGSQNDVPILTGNNLDESGAKPRQEITLADYESRAREKYGDLADEFLRLYPATTDAEAGDQLNASLREATRVSTYLWAGKYGETAASPVFTYYWTHAPAGEEDRGAYHGSEIDYIFDNLHVDDRPYTATDRQIATTFSDHVVNFVAHGHPDGPGQGRWLPVDPDSPTTLRIGDSWARMTLTDDPRLDFIGRFFAGRNPW
ncbi:carboxylesterase/lipase family protein [Streptomyces sp. cg40]|uniref:carboxylesterase/lipase family protein n=1 Tax=Streptomyces sp. cg40 TaxID=3419764 RepID=UPI003CFCDFDF